MKHFPYVFPVEAWQYEGWVPFIGAPAWTLPYLTFVASDGILVVAKPHHEMKLNPGDWLVRFPTGDLAMFPDDSFKGLFNVPCRDPANILATFSVAGGGLAAQDVVA